MKKMKKSCFISAVFAVMLWAILPAVSFAQEENVNPSDYFDIYTTEYAERVVDFLASERLKGRETGTKGAVKAMKFIVKEFKKAGYKPLLQSFNDRELADAIGKPKEGKDPYPQSQCNVVAELKGKNYDKYIVVGAHYDHLGYKEGVGIHPGADDNASGVVALLSLAKMMKATGIVPEYTLLFCAWDGEEKGLLGSKYFVNTWPDSNIVPTITTGSECQLGTKSADSLISVKCAGSSNGVKKSSLKESVVCYMNFDMVGRTITPENPGVTFAWNNNYPYLLDICEKAQKSIPAPFQVLLDERRGDGKGGSDYAPFSAQDIPFIAWMEDFMHEDYHKPTDTPEKLHWEKLRKTILLAYVVLWRLAM